MKLGFIIPLRTKSAANLREHWAAKAKRVKAERLATFAAFPRNALGQLGVLDTAATAHVQMVRVAPRALDDDNLRPALKAVRDEIARLLGVDDRDPRVEWGYGQAKGKPKEHAVLVSIDVF